MKIMITGSAGYIGSCLFEYLKKKYESTSAITKHF